MVDYFGTDTVVSELRDDGLLIIRINRPEVANALNGVTSAAHGEHHEPRRDRQSGAAPSS